MYSGLQDAQCSVGQCFFVECLPLFDNYLLVLFLNINILPKFFQDGASYDGSGNRERPVLRRRVDQRPFEAQQPQRQQQQQQQQQLQRQQQQQLQQQQQQQEQQLQEENFYRQQEQQERDRISQELETVRVSLREKTNMIRKIDFLTCFFFYPLKISLQKSFFYSIFSPYL